MNIQEVKSSVESLVNGRCIVSVFEIEGGFRVRVDHKNPNPMKDHLPKSLRPSPEIAGNERCTFELSEGQQSIDYIKTCIPSSWEAQ